MNWPVKTIKEWVIESQRPRIDEGIAECMRRGYPDCVFSGMSYSLHAEHYRKQGHQVFLENGGLSMRIIFKKSGGAL